MHELQDRHRAVLRCWSRRRPLTLTHEQRLRQFRDALTAGTVRAAEKVDGAWQTNAWVKKGILLGFRIGVLAESGDPRRAAVR